MGRENLAINRDDFTQKGHMKIRDEIYPSIVKVAHEALEDCDKKIVEENNRIFEAVKKIINNEEEEYDNQKQQKQKISELDKKAYAERIHNAILSAIGLAAFAQIRSAAICLIPNAKETCKNWNQLLKEISGLIIEKQEKEKEGKALIGWTKSSFFYLQVKELEINNNIMRIKSGDKSTNIAAILKELNKYAIVSRRSSETTSWVETLVFIPQFSEENDIRKCECKNSTDRGGKVFIKDDIMALKNQWLLKERKQTVAQIENWGENFRYAFQCFDQKHHEQIKYQQHQIMRWILGNVPSIALFSDISSNTRINIMSLEHTDSMYFDRNFKWNIYKRMIETYESNKIERFSTVAFTGYCRLALPQNPSSVYYVKRGKFSQIGQRYNIIPFNGKVLQKIFSTKNKLKEKIELDKILTEEGAKEFLYELEQKFYVCNENNILYPVWKHFSKFSEYVMNQIRKQACSLNTKCQQECDQCLYFESEQKTDTQCIEKELNNNIIEFFKPYINGTFEVKWSGTDLSKYNFTKFNMDDKPLEKSFKVLWNLIMKETESKVGTRESDKDLTPQDIMEGYTVLLTLKDKANEMYIKSDLKKDIVKKLAVKESSIKKTDEKKESSENVGRNEEACEQDVSEGMFKKGVSATTSIKNEICEKLCTGRNELLETITVECGLKKGEDDGQKFDGARETMKQLIEAVSKKSWIKLPTEQSYQLYELFVSEVVDEVVDMVVDEIIDENVGEIVETLDETIWDKQQSLFDELYLVKILSGENPDISSYNGLSEKNV